MESFLSELQSLAQQALALAETAVQLPQAQALLLLAARGLLPLLSVLLLLRCGRSMLRDRPEQEVWGSLVLENGTPLPLCHWENLIGRAKRCDVILPFHSVSRSHAVLIRNGRGCWTLYSLGSKNGVTLNGAPVPRTAEVQPQDVIGFGGVLAWFVPLTEEEERQQTKLRTRPGRAFSPSVTLLLLTVIQLLLLLSLLLTMGEDQQLALLAFGILLGIQWLLYVVYRLARRTGFELEALAFFLCSLCLTVTASSAPSSLVKQAVAIGLGVALFFAMNLVLRDLQLAKRLRLPLAVGSAALLVFNLLFGSVLFGARNWIIIGPISFQPSELVKLVFILVGAATLDKLFDKKNLLGSLVFSVFCVGCLGLMSDFGTALIFFVAFLAITFLRSGDLASVLFMVAAAALGCVLILHYKSYIAQRFTIYRHVWEDPSNFGYQQTRTMSAIASGGLFGRGPCGGWLKNLGAANTDLVFGVVSEELGLIVALCAVSAIVLMVAFAVRQASAARSSFYVICSCTAGMLLVVQTMLNVFGSVDLLPLTGVTLPFVSVGGTSMLSCWGLLAFLKTADTRQNASLSVRLPSRKTSAAQAPAASPAEAPHSASPENHPPEDTPLHTDADDWEEYFQWDEGEDHP